MSASAGAPPSHAIFTTAEGGAQHCQHEYLTVATTTCSEWLAEKLAS